MILVFRLVCAYCEARFYRAICNSKAFGKYIGLFTLVFLLASAGMFHASTAFLPTTTAMYFCMLGYAGWLEGDSTTAIFATASKPQNIASLPLFNIASLPLFNIASLPLFNIASLPLFNIASLPLFNIASLPLFNIKPTIAMWDVFSEGPKHRGSWFQNTSRIMKWGICEKEI